MVVMLYIFAALQFIGGIGTVAWSRGAMPEILGTLLVGFSIITVGLASILAEVAWSRKLLEKQIVWSRKLLETQMALSEQLFEEQHPQAAAQGQVRELLDFLTWISSFEGFTLRPTIASYS